MNSLVRFFDIEDETKLLMEGNNVIVPQRHTVVFVFSEPYDVSDITYDYDLKNNNALIDVILTKIDMEQRVLH